MRIAGGGLGGGEGGGGEEEGGSMEKLRLCCSRDTDGDPG